MMFLNKLQRFVLFVSLLSLGSIGVSCSKGETSEQLVDSETSLSFAVENVGEVADAGVIKGDETAPAEKPDLEPMASGLGSTARATTKKAVAAVNTSFVPAAATVVGEAREVVGDGYDAIVTLTEEDNSVKSSNGRFINTKVSSAAGGSTANVAAAMTSGNKYRVLIYDNSDNYMGTIDATSGTALSPAFPVFKNTTYKWYAYSYNSQTQVPVPTNTANPTISTTAGAAGLLYDSGTLTTVAGSNKISIVFEHRLASIAVKVDARGLFTTINSVAGTNGTAGDLRSGTLNLKTGVYTNTSANTTKSDLLNWTNAAAATGDSVKVAYLYTSGTTPISNFKVTLSNLKVNLDDGSVRTFENKTFEFANSFTPQLGKRYTATITLIESAITAGGVRWARENLYYRAGDTGYRFRNKSSNIYQTNVADLTSTTEFFSFGASTSANNATPAVRDVCKLAFPKNTWRLPSAAEQQALAAVTTGSTPYRVFGQSSDARYAAWRYNTSDEYGTSWTSFMALGRREKGTNDIENYSRTGNSSGYFWSATYQQNTANAYYMRVDVLGTSNNNFSGSTVEAGLIESSNMRYGMNIRCVRND